jgi:hypothetical protein
MRIQPWFEFVSCSHACTSATSSGVEANVYVPNPRTIVEALTIAEKSVLVPPPGVSQSVAFAGVAEWKRAPQVVSPAAAADPVSPFFVPSFQDCNMRRKSKIESTLDGLGVFVTLIVSFAEVTVALVGMLPAMSNLMRARLREAAPLTPAVVPIAVVEFTPRLLLGSCSNKVVSATGVRVTVSASTCLPEKRLTRTTSE